MKTVVIVQSNYIPWKGYFDLINSADCFVIYDDVQYTKRDWRNRNRIKTASGCIWLTIPVSVKGQFNQKIQDVKVRDSAWVDTHWKSLQQNYSRAPFFEMYNDDLCRAYSECKSLELLSEINAKLMRKVCEFIAIRTQFYRSDQFDAVGDATERLVSICAQLEAERYLTGPAACSYIDEERFAAEGVTVEYFDYSDYPEYQQLYGPFVHEVSILDLLFCVGPEVQNFMKSFSGVKKRRR